MMELLKKAERTVRDWHKTALAMRDLALVGDIDGMDRLYIDTALRLPFYGVDPAPLPSDAGSAIIRSALTVGRDCVMESFDHVENKDDQMLADARLRDLDQAIEALDA